MLAASSEKEQLQNALKVITEKNQTQTQQYAILDAEHQGKVALLNDTAALLQQSANREAALKTTIEQLQESLNQLTLE